MKQFFVLVISSMLLISCGSKDGSKSGADRLKTQSLTEPSEDQIKIISKLIDRIDLLNSSIYAATHPDSKDKVQNNKELNEVVDIMTKSNCQYEVNEEPNYFQEIDLQGTITLHTVTGNDCPVQANKVISYNKKQTQKNIHSFETNMNSNVTLQKKFQEIFGLKQKQITYNDSTYSESDPETNKSLKYIFSSNSSTTIQSDEFKTLEQYTEYSSNYQNIKNNEKSSEVIVKNLDVYISVLGSTFKISTQYRVDEKSNATEIYFINDRVATEEEVCKIHCISISR